MTLTYIRWFDASHQRGECSKSELITRCVLHSAGQFVQEDDDSVTIAADHYAADETYRHISHIPKVNILERRDFEFEPQRDGKKRKGKRG